MPEKPLYTCEEVARMYGVKIRTLWGWIRDYNIECAPRSEAMRLARQGKLEVISPRARYYLRPSDLIKIEQAHEKSKF